MASDIAAAVARARYNEAVVVTVDDGASSRELVLVACLDEENGGVVWRDAAASPYSDGSGDGSAGDGNGGGGHPREDVGIVRHLRTKRWVLPMLNDHRRNRLYDSAVRSACREMVKRRREERDRCNKAETNGSGTDETIRILDIGSGTGLLAMTGARHTLGAIKEQSSSETDGTVMKVQVTSVEMAAAMARLARLTVEENNLSKNVVVVETHSADANFGVDDARFEQNATSGVENGDNTDGVAMNEKADICTSELLESGLLGEGVLPAIRDAWQRHLKPDAIVVPRRARVFAVLVEGMPIDNGDTNKGTEETSVNAATAFCGPELHSFKEASGGVWLSMSSQPTSDSTGDGSKNDGEVLLGGLRCGGATGGGISDGVTVPLHANAMLDEEYRDKSAHLSNDQSSAFRGLRPLTDPTEVLDFDFASGLDALPPTTGRSVATTVVPTADGECHGVLFWWELDLWDGDRDGCTYSTEPIGFVKRPSDGEDGSRDELWQDHWQQCLFLFGDGHSIGNGTRQLTKGSPVELIASHDDTSISFKVEAGCAFSEGGDERPSQRRKLNGSVAPPQSTFNRHITPVRALQLNDSSRIQTLRDSIHHCLNLKGLDAPLLDLSDTGVCAMIAAVSGATKVTSLESSSGAMPTLAATIAQIGNGLPRVGCEFQIIQALPEHLSKEHVAGGAAEIIVAEPYYEILEGWHLQEALNYFHLVRSLKARGAISASALSVPARARLMACVVQFDDFTSAYGRVGDIGGFRHDSVNRCGDRYHTYDVSLPLWQYRYRRLSNSFCVATMSYEGASPTIDTTDGLVELAIEGVAHAVVFWVDYACHCGGDEGDYAIISTASTSHQQIVRKLDEPIPIAEADVKGGAKFRCSAAFGDDANGIECHSFSFERIAGREDR